MCFSDSSLLPVVQSNTHRRDGRAGTGCRSAADAEVVSNRRQLLEAELGLSRQGGPIWLHRIVHDTAWPISCQRTDVGLETKVKITSA